MEKKGDLFSKVMDEKVAQGNSKILHEFLWTRNRSLEILVKAAESVWNYMLSKA
jgi:hypothetical protein